MGFQVGLSIPGLTEAWLNPHPWDGLGQFGKGIGGALDQALGWDDKSREFSMRERLSRIAHPGGGEGGGTLHVDDYGNITEDPLPDSTYNGTAGTDLGKQPALFGGRASVGPVSASAGVDTDSFDEAVHGSDSFPSMAEWSAKNCPT